MREGLCTRGIHDGKAAAEWRVNADRSLDFLQGDIVPFDIESSEGRVLTCTEKVALGVLVTVSEFVAEMTAVCPILASSSKVGSVDGLGAGSRPEGAKA